MSHNVIVGTQILDLEALKASCPELGLEFHENQKTHKAYFNGTCDHAISVKGAKSNCYEIGVKKSTSGLGYHLIADNWEGGYGLIDKVGQDACKLSQEYALRVAEKKIPAGFHTRRTVLDNGHVQLHAVRR